MIYKQYHKLSRDYERLWELINSGFVLACWVDNDISTSGNKRVIRDIARVRKIRNDYYVSCRSKTYTSVDSFEYTSIERAKELFIKRCDAINLEFISHD